MFYNLWTWIFFMLQDFFHTQRICILQRLFIKADSSRWKMSPASFVALAFLVYMICPFIGFWPWKNCASDLLYLWEVLLMSYSLLNDISNISNCPLNNLLQSEAIEGTKCWGDTCPHIHDGNLKVLILSYFVMSAMFCMACKLAAVPCLCSELCNKQIPSH